MDADGQREAAAALLELCKKVNAVAPLESLPQQPSKTVRAAFAACAADTAGGSKSCCSRLPWIHAIAAFCSYSCTITGSGARFLGLYACKARLACPLLAATSP